LNLHQCIVVPLMITAPLRSCSYSLHLRTFTSWATIFLCVLPSGYYADVTSYPILFGELFVCCWRRSENYYFHYYTVIFCYLISVCYKRVCQYVKAGELVHHRSQRIEDKVVSVHETQKLLMLWVQQQTTQYKMATVCVRSRKDGVQVSKYICMAWHMFTVATIHYVCLIIGINFLTILMWKLIK
jgi:hypothetical protein